jgi:tRNA(fMet)-specific endonuclease VapC
VKYLLDSNICIATMNQMASTKARAALNMAIASGSELYISSIVAFELWFGVSKSLHVQANANRVVEFLTEPFRVLAFDTEDAGKAGEIRAELARQGTPIGPYDVLIAGQAVARGLTLVTANMREFSRVDGLKILDWTN